MSRTLTEKKVLNKLGIDNFREITKDKVIELVSLYDRMDPEAVKKALDQFPDFSKTMYSVLKDYKSLLDESLKENGQSMKETYAIFNDISKCCQTILEQDSLTLDDKMRVMNLMVEVAKLKAAKDTENKHFLLTFGTIGLAAVVLVGNTLLIALGGNSRVTFKPTN